MNLSAYEEVNPKLQCPNGLPPFFSSLYPLLSTPSDMEHILTVKRGCFGGVFLQI